MKKVFILLLAAIILITIAACGETPQNNASQNEPGESVSITPSIEFEPDTSSSMSGSSLSPEIEPNKNEKPEVGDIENIDNTLQSNLGPQSSSVTESAVVPQRTSETSTKEGEKNNVMPNINITVGGSVFSAKLYDNNTARVLSERFPVTLNMSELNGNEKYYYLPDSLPADSRRVGSIQAGDLMLYGSDCIVLFYESFSSSYSYTKLGYIEDASGLAAALGSGSVDVMFAVCD